MEKECISTVDGKEHKLDVLVCVTGFDTSYIPCLGVVGEGGRSMEKEWETEVKSYLGMAVAGFLN